MADPLELREELDAALELALTESKRYLEALDTAPVRSPGVDELADAIGGRLPEQGDGALVALNELLGHFPAAVGTAGPRSSTS